MRASSWTWFGTRSVSKAGTTLSWNTLADQPAITQARSTDLASIIGRYADDIESAPRGLFLALDHATFVGILTNAIVGLLLVVCATRREIWAWADALVFWGINVGLATFLVGLVGNEAVIKRIGTPIMGASILLGLLTAAIRLRGQPTLSPTTTVAA
ncbi:MAG: hypothetical protein ABJC60_09770 [Actinomycetota bacterium]